MSLDPIKVQDTSNWFRKAKNDIRAAELLVSDSDLVDEVAFHCQQAVEKCLKGYLFWNGHPFEKKHDLNLLSQNCLLIDGSLNSVLIGVAPLTQYAVEYRYPGPLVHPTDAEARGFIQLSKTVYGAIAPKLPFAIS